MALTDDWLFCSRCRVTYQGEHDCSDAKVTIRPSTPMGWKCPECLQVWAPSVESCKNHGRQTPADDHDDFVRKLRAMEMTLSP